MSSLWSPLPSAARRAAFGKIARNEARLAWRRPAVQAIQASMLRGFPPAAPLLVLAAYAVVSGFAARRFFRWE